CFRVYICFLFLFFFFFQAEDGIRDFHVTGVQTCALPIWLDTNNDGFIDRGEAAASPRLAGRFDQLDANKDGKLSREEMPRGKHRSEERRVGKECRSRW